MLYGVKQVSWVDPLHALYRLLHPVVVDEQENLVAGLRRLKACESLGWKEVPVTVVSLRDLAKGEVDENRERKDFTITEIGDIDNHYEPIISEEAKGRQEATQLAGRDSTGKPVTKQEVGESTVDEPKGRTDDKIAKLCGIGKTTLHRVRAILKAAKENPKKFDKMIKKVDSGQTSIAYAYQSVVLHQKHANPPPLDRSRTQRGPLFQLQVGRSSALNSIDSPGLPEPRLPQKQISRP